ncbi:MAG: 4-hydroxythreonine-4-phosphate dehydrogenase PdxA [Ignavibacteriales bacterium]|nr:4-hydroxythreonine-4-phosphate dehydrogenase PdxA [Ignavibacteriales bacterium]
MHKPLIAISCGDYNGIGTEVTLKAVRDKSIQNICTPILVGTKKNFDYYDKKLKLNHTFEHFNSFQKKNSSSLFFLEVANNFPYKIQPGKLTKDSGRISILSTELATALCVGGIASAVVTAPVSKEAMILAGFKHLGQTEFVAELSGSKNFGMMLMTPAMRVSLVTVHHPLKDVPSNISQKAIVKKLELLSTSLRNDFGITKPRIAVLGLNPHAGENGLLGKEDGEIIIPAIQSFKEKNVIVKGPFPADAFFGEHKYKNFDAVLAMYHDQGLIPLKMSGMNEGVNFTMGLPIVRTSPAHGTAFDIAGKGIANPSSMIAAIKSAVHIARRRI